MDFTLNEEQEMFLAMFRDFSTKEVAPGVEALDHEEALPLAVLRKAAEQGFLGAMLPEAYGGAELDVLSYVLLVETLARDSLSLAVTLAAHVSLVAMSILGHGTDAQKEAWLPQMAAGEAFGAFALTEPDAGSDEAALQTRATYEGEEVVLDGVKAWVTNGGIADLFLVFARGPQGTEVFLAPKEAPGLAVGYREPTLGLRSVTFDTVYLEGCRVLEADRLGGVGEGEQIAGQAWDRMAVALAAAGLGAAEASVDTAVQFAAERVQFGGPIARKQAIQSYIAQAQIDVEALRYLVYHAAWLADRGEDYSCAASQAKVFAARVARDVTNRMLQVLGGYGYMEDYPMARRFRDARALGVMGGPTELHQVRVAQKIFAGGG